MAISVIVFALVFLVFLCDLVPKKVLYVFELRVVLLVASWVSMVVKLIYLTECFVRN